MVPTTGAPDHPGTNHTMTIEQANSIANYLEWAQGSKPSASPKHKTYLALFWILESRSRSVMNVVNMVSMDRVG